MSSKRRRGDAGATFEIERESDKRHSIDPVVARIAVPRIMVVPCSDTESRRSSGPGSGRRESERSGRSSVSIPVTRVPSTNPGYVGRESPKDKPREHSPSRGRNQRTENIRHRQSRSLSGRRSHDRSRSGGGGGSGGPDGSGNVNPSRSQSQILDATRPTSRQSQIPVQSPKSFPSQTAGRSQNPRRSRESRAAEALREKGEAREPSSRERRRKSVPRTPRVTAASVTPSDISVETAILLPRESSPGARRKLRDRKSSGTNPHHESSAKRPVDASRPSSRDLGGFVNRGFEDDVELGRKSKDGNVFVAIPAKASSTSPTRKSHHSQEHPSFSKTVSSSPTKSPVKPRDDPRNDSLLKPPMTSGGRPRVKYSKAKENVEMTGINYKKPSAAKRNPTARQMNPDRHDGQTENGELEERMRQKHDEWDRRGSSQSLVSLAASDASNISNVSNLSAISARCHDMSYIYQIYHERRGSFNAPKLPPKSEAATTKKAATKAATTAATKAAVEAAVMRRQSRALMVDEEEVDLVSPWDDPVPYHLAMYKDEPNYEMKLKIFSGFLHFLLFVVVVAGSALGMVGYAKPGLVGVVLDPNDALDPNWQWRLGFQRSPIGGSWRLDKLHHDFLSFYLTDEKSCLAFHGNRVDQFWMHMAGVDVDIYYFNATGKHGSAVLGNEIQDPDADFHVFFTNQTIVAAKLRNNYERGIYAMINVFFATPIENFTAQPIDIASKEQLERDHPHPSDKRIIGEFFVDGKTICD